VDRDARELARFGYAQELRRRFGSFSSFAIGFSVISVLTGVTSTFAFSLEAGGPAGLGLGWPLVSVGTMLVALAMAELASAFPTAGALYHWSALLGGAAPGWWTAMLNLAGQLAMVAAIDLACAQAIAQMFGASDAAAFGFFAAIVALHGALNAISIRVVAWLNDASATVHVVGVAALSGLLLAFGRLHGPTFLAQGVPSARGFVVALVLGVWTFTGFDAAAHVSEETHDPARRAPFGIVSSVAVSAIAGFALVASLLLAVREPGALAGRSDAALVVLREALGETAGRAALGLIAVAMWFAGLSSVTSASRMLFAFARDGGVPLASWIRRVSPRTRTPLGATLACVLVPIALVFATARASAGVFLAIAALATVALYASYALPIALGAFARARGRWRRMGPWNLGRAGQPIAWSALAWTVGVGTVCTLANPLGMELFAGLLATLLVVWRFAVRGTFVGPTVDLAHFEEP
jgi:amino acid transporter